MDKSLAGWKLSIAALGGKLGADWERDRRDTLFLMAAIGITISTHLHHLPLWVSIAFAILFFWRLGLVFSGRRLPGAVVRLCAAAAAALGVYAYYRTLFGRDAGVALLVLFLGLKLMEMKAKRDLFVVIFLCMFLILLSFLYSQSIGSATLALLAILTLVATLMSMQFGYHEAPVLKRFKLSGQLLVRALPIALVMFFLFPRIDQPLWKMPTDSSKGRTGLSDSMAPGRFSQLMESDAIAFRVRFEGEVPAQEKLYWRGPVLGSFDGVTWRTNRYDVVSPPKPKVIAGSAAHHRFTYTITMEPQSRNYLLALEHPIAIPAISERTAILQPDYQLTSTEVSAERFRFTVTSSTTSQIGLEETRLSLQNWLSLPPGFNPKTLQLALDWRNEENDPARLVQKALAMFREEQFFYTLEPPLMAQHSVDEFLFTHKRGFCEHYSQAFVVLMRALDIPARVVTGYQGGEMNPVDGFLTVRQRDAHAWAEVWLEGRGWVRIDPTAMVAPERIQRPVRSSGQLNAGSTSAGSTDLWAQLRFRLDAISNGWNQWMLNYDRSKQKSLMQRLGLDPDNWQQLVGLLAVMLAIALGIVALISLRPKQKPDPVETVYREVLQRLEGLGVVKSKGETAGKLALRVQAELPQYAAAFSEIVSAYNKLRYEYQTIDSKQLQHLRQLARQFKQLSRP